MQIIPVLDLSNNTVVHAKQGERKNYAPVASELCTSSSPISVLECFLNLSTFKIIYIADLDALESRGHNSRAIENICNLFPNLEFWLDSGTSLIPYYLDKCKLKNLRMVLSTESINSVMLLRAYTNQYANHEFILSLDFKHDKILGEKSLLSEIQKWPFEILILNLDKVGINSGLKIPKQLTSLNFFNTHQAFYGGGVRNINDIQSLKSQGLAGALISTSLHNKSITERDLTNFNQ